MVNAKIEAESKPFVSQGFEPVIRKKAEEKRIEGPATMLKFLLSHIIANPHKLITKMFAIKPAVGLMFQRLGEGRQIPKFSKNGVFSVKQKESIAIASIRVPEMTMPGVPNISRLLSFDVEL